MSLSLQWMNYDVYVLCSYAGRPVYKLQCQLRRVYYDSPAPPGQLLTHLHTHSGPAILLYAVWSSVLLLWRNWSFDHCLQTRGLHHPATSCVTSVLTLVTNQNTTTAVSWHLKGDAGGRCSRSVLSTSCRANAEKCACIVLFPLHVIPIILINVWVKIYFKSSHYTQTAWTLNTIWSNWYSVASSIIDRNIPKASLTINCVYTHGLTVNWNASITRNRQHSVKQSARM